jgi:hypothetical protein
MPRFTPSGKKTKLGSFEDKVSASALPGGESEKYAIANKIGLMRGNQATAKGKKAAAPTVRSSIRSAMRGRSGR